MALGYEDWPQPGDLFSFGAGQRLVRGADSSKIMIYLMLEVSAKPAWESDNVEFTYIIFGKGGEPPRKNTTKFLADSMVRCYNLISRQLSLAW